MGAKMMTGPGAVLVLAVMMPLVPGQGNVVFNRPEDNKTANHKKLKPSAVESRVRAVTTQYAVHMHQSSTLARRCAALASHALVTSGLLTYLACN
jgi:hypothetical protein